MQKKEKKKKIEKIKKKDRKKNYLLTLLRWRNWVSEMNRRSSNWRLDLWSLCWLGFALLLLHCRYSLASIHEYDNEQFEPQSNSFFFNGGSEGLYATKHHSPEPVSVSASDASSDRPRKGKSFIRYKVFWICCWILCHLFTFAFGNA